MSEICPTVRIRPSHPSQGAFVEINASDFDPTRHEQFDAPPPPPAAPPPPPPPPPPVDALAVLPADWREWPSTKLRELAVSVTGRTPEDGKQAVEMIDAELAKRPPTTE